MLYCKKIRNLLYSRFYYIQPKLYFFRSKIICFSYIAHIKIFLIMLQKLDRLNPQSLSSYVWKRYQNLQYIFKPKTFLNLAASRLILFYVEQNVQNKFIFGKIYKFNLSINQFIIASLKSLSE